MSVFDPINNGFEKKIQSLNDAIGKLTSLGEPPKGTIPLAMKKILEEIRSLYEINQEIYIIIDKVRNEIINHTQTQPQTNLKNEVKNLKERFDTTFGALEGKLNKINDESKSGDNPFYV